MQIRIGVVAAAFVLCVGASLAHAAPPGLMDVPGVAARLIPTVVSITTRDIHRGPQQEPELRRDVADLALFEVDLAQDVGVLGLDRWHELADARACGVVKLGVQDVLGRGTGSHPVLQEGKERAMLRDEGLDHLGVRCHAAHCRRTTT